MGAGERSAIRALVLLTLAINAVGILVCLVGSLNEPSLVALGFLVFNAAMAGFNARSLLS